MEGRDADLGALAAELARAHERRHLALVAGEPGIGKTRLVSEFAGDAQANGAIVLYGRSNDGPDPPFGPFVEALGHYLRHGPDDAIDAEVRAELARIIPEAGRRLSPPEVAADADTGSEQFVLFGAVATLLARAARDGPLILVLEDLHWADQGTLLLLRHLMTGAEEVSMLVIGTYRPTDVATDDPLAAAIAELARERQVSRHRLSALAPEDALLLLTELAGHGFQGSDAELAVALHRETGGNPLFLTELVRALLAAGSIRVEEGRWSIDDELRSTALPGSVTEVIQQRVAALGDEVRHALAAAAVIGQEFDPELVERALDRGCEEMGERWDAAERAGLVLETEPGLLGFNHPLVQRALYDGLGSRSRGQLHRRVAEAIEVLDRSEDAAELARHWCRAAPAEPGRARLWAARAGRHALDRYDGNAARHWYEKALKLHERSGEEDERTRCELLVGLGAAQRQVGDQRFRETLLDGARLADRLDCSELLVQAALLNNHGFASVSGAVDAEKVAVLEAALRAVGDADSRERARLLATLAVELTFSGQWERRVAISDEAVAIARRLGDPMTLSRVLTMRFVPTWMPQTLEERQVSSAEALRLADELGDPWTQLHAARWRFVGLVQAGALGEAGPVLERELKLARALGDPTSRWLSTYDRGTLALIAGRLDEAEELADEAFATGSGPRDGRPMFTSLLTAIRYEQGRLPELQSTLAGVVAENPGLPVLGALLALGYAEGELREEARNLLASQVETGFAEIPADPSWLATHGIYAHVAAELRDRAAADALYERLAPWTGQIVYVGVSAWGSVDRAVGRLAAVLGRYEEAELRLEAAIERCGRIGAPIWLARGQLDLAGVLLARDAPGDRERAVEALEAAITGAARLGAATVERRARSLREHQRAMDVASSSGLGGQRLRIAASSGGLAARNGAPPITAGENGFANGGAEHANGHPGVAGAPGEPAGKLRREGDYWVMRLRDREVRLRDSKGIAYLANLIAQPGVELHAVDLQAGGWGAEPSAAARDAAAQASRGELGGGMSVRAAGSEDAGTVLDAAAKRDYRDRIEELEAEIEEAERFNDPERASLRREELEFIGRELAAAVGLGGRDRKSASQAERARVNVTRAIRNTLERIGEHDEVLGDHLRSAVRTGSFCCYEPGADQEIEWEVSKAGA